MRNPLVNEALLSIAGHDRSAVGTHPEQALLAVEAQIR